MKRLYMKRLSGFFFIVLLFNVFTVTKLPIRDLAFTTMEWTFYAATFILGYTFHQRLSSNHKMLWPRHLMPFYSGITLLIAIYLLGHLINGNYYSNNELTQFLLYFIFLYAMAHIKWRFDAFIIFAYLSVTMTVLFFIHWLMLDMPINNFQSYIRNPNILAAFLSCLLFFPLISFKDIPNWQKGLFGVSILLSFIMIYATSARAVILLLITVAGARTVLMLSKKIFEALFYIVLLFNFIFLFLYTTIAKSSLFVELNEWSVEKFGKNLFSGRQNVWELAFNYGLEKPVLGHKVGILPKEYIPDAHYVHVHNQYLQIFLESGLLGLACFIVFLFGIWQVFQKNLDSNVVKWSASFFLGILIYQNVEVSLFFNMEPIGLFQWFIIGIGLSGVLYANKFGKTVDKYIAD